MELWVRMMSPVELACYAMRSDGEDRCHVAFAGKKYVVSKSGLHLNGAIVRIIEVFYQTMKTEPPVISTTIIEAMMIGKIIHLPTQHDNM